MALELFHPGQVDAGVAVEATARFNLQGNAARVKTKSAKLAVQGSGCSLGIFFNGRSHLFVWLFGKRVKDFAEQFIAGGRFKETQYLQKRPAQPGLDYIFTQTQFIVRVAINSVTAANVDFLGAPVAPDLGQVGNQGSVGLH